MNRNECIKVLASLGKKLEEMLSTFYEDDATPFMQTLLRARHLNPWFTFDNQLLALRSIVSFLDERKLTSWLKQYPGLHKDTTSPKTIGIIMAGNIPLVGFHDLLCVMLSGNKALIKLSSDDQVLLPFLASLLETENKEMHGYIHFAGRISGIDAVIATGSDNSARYFEYYFGKYPHIIRKNRNAVAVLSGSENDDELSALGDDIFSYFGMGCRNVSKLYVPNGYNFNLFFEVMEKYKNVTEHTRYMNNFEYYHSILLMKQVSFLTNNFLIIKEDTALATPVSIVNYEYYENEKALQKRLDEDADKIQCIIGTGNDRIPFGRAQQPGLMDYADGVDTMQFLEKLE